MDEEEAERRGAGPRGGEQRCPVDETRIFVGPDGAVFFDSLSPELLEVAAALDPDDARVAAFCRAAGAASPAAADDAVPVAADDAVPVAADDAAPEGGAAPGVAAGAEGGVGPASGGGSAAGGGSASGGGPASGPDPAAVAGSGGGGAPT